MKKRILPLGFILMAALLLPLSVQAQAGQCDGTSGNNTINCTANPTTPNINIDANLGNDIITVAAGVQVGDIYGDGMAVSTLIEASGSAPSIGNGGSDIITNNGVVIGDNNIVGDYVTVLIGNGGNGGSDTIINNGPAYNLIGDFATGNGGDDTITNNSSVYTIIGDGLADDGSGGDDDIVNSEGAVAYYIAGDGKLNDEDNNGNGGEDTITNDGTVLVDIFGDAIVEENATFPSGRGASDEIRNAGRVGGVIYAEGGDDFVRLWDGSNGGTDNLLPIDGGTGNDRLAFELDYTTINQLYGTPAAGIATLDGQSFQWVNFEQILDVPLPVLTAPTGTINTNYGNPNYVWNAVQGAQSYGFYIDDAANDGIPFYRNDNLASATYCIGDICSFNPVTLSETARLPRNGEYVVYIWSIVNGNLGGVGGPFRFTLQANPPAPATVLAPLETDTFRPTLRWTLNANSDFSTAFQLYVVPKAQFDAGNYTPAFLQWFWRADLCGGPSGTTCSFALPVDLLDNTEYYFAIQGYAPGGFSTGGEFSNGWARVTFTIDVARPPLPTLVSVNPQQGRPAITFTSSAEADAHFVAVYNWTAGVWAYGILHEKGVSSALDCIGTTCQLIDDDMILANGTYSVYVNSIADGVPSEGGPFANGFVGPTDGANTSELGDFTLNFLAPELVNELSATYSTGSVSASWQAVQNATWYYVWIGTAGGATTNHFQWYSSIAGGCPAPTVEDPQTCNLNIPLTLFPGTYYIAVQSAGPGGFSTGGPFNNGFEVNLTGFVVPGS
jgi:hypothetical protein